MVDHSKSKGTAHFFGIAAFCIERLVTGLTCPVPPADRPEEYTLLALAIHSLSAFRIQNLDPFASQSQSEERTTNYALFAQKLHESSHAVPQHLVLAGNPIEGLMRISVVEGDHVDSGELQGKFRTALKRIGGKADSADSVRQKPIYQKNSPITEQDALEEAAKALTALWRVGRPAKS